MTSLPAHLRDLLAAELAPGESVIHAEQPDPTRYMRIVGWIGFVLGIPLAVYAIWMIVDGVMGEQRWTDGSQITPSLAVFYALPALGIALAFLTAPLHNGRSARNTVYAITDRRVLILQRRFLRAPDRQSIPAATLQVKVKPNRTGDGGDIDLVGSETIDDEDRDAMFRMIALRDVRATEAALRRLVQSSSKSSL